MWALAAEPGGGGGGGGAADLAISQVMQGPHAHTVVVVIAPIIFLVLKGLDKSIIFFTIRFFGGLALPCPLINGFLLLVLHFLGWCFLGGLFLARWLQLGVLDGSTPAFLFQQIDLCIHGHDLFLFFSGLAPGVFFIKKSCFIFVLCMDNRKISMIFPLVSCCSCVNIPSSS